MLPLELSTDICSLRPQVDRLVLSCVMEIDHRGEIVGYEIAEGVIRSAERMTYTDVNAILEGDAAAAQALRAAGRDFELMRDLALILNRKRERRGSIDFDLPGAGHRIRRERADEERYALGTQHRAPPDRRIHALGQRMRRALSGDQTHRLLYRIHEKPDAKRVYDFETIAATFGYSLGVGALPIQRVQVENRPPRRSYGTGQARHGNRNPQRSAHHAAHVSEADGENRGQAGRTNSSYLMLRSLKQARYSEENVGHFALAARPTRTSLQPDPALSGPDRPPDSERCVERAPRETDGASHRSKSAL